MTGSERKVETMDMRDCGISSFAGIENFSSLTDFYCERNPITSFTVPASISYLQCHECQNLTNFEVAEGNQTYTAADGILYSKDMTELVSYPAAKPGEKYTVPSSVTAIAYGAFMSGSTLKTVEIPDAVQEIEWFAFCDFTSLQTITIGSGVTDIGEKAFHKCDDLKDVYYNGTAEQWKAVQIGLNNESLQDAVMHYADGTTHIHSWDAGKVTKEATEDTNGVMTYTCTLCGAEKCMSIPYLSHEHSYKAVVTAPTCTEKGYTTHTCACGDSYVDTYVDALGHAWNAGKVTEAPTEAKTGVKTFTCHNCGDTYTESIPALGYTYNETVVAPTCTEDGYTMHECVEDATKSFKDNIVPALGHEYKEVTTPATCKDAGSVDKVCERCNDKQHVRDIPVNEEHQWDEGVITKEPTATEPGIKTYTCTVCNKTKTESIAKVHVHEYTGLGEIVKEPSCETEGERWMYCTNDGCDSKILVPMPAIGSHDWDFEHTECLKKATCTEPGTMLMHCKRDASHTMTYSYGGTGHIWDEGVITTQPTHDEYGVKTLHCKNCDATMTEKVLPTKYTFTVTVVPPTCTEDGYTMHKCNQDDSLSYKDNIVHSTGHHAAMRVIEPTCKEEGRTEIYCTVCGEVSTVLSTTPKKDHTWDNGVVTTEPTAEKEGVKTYTCKVCNETKTETIPRLNGSGK